MKIIKNVKGLAGMLGRLNHVAIATPDIEKSSKFYKDLGAKVSDKVVSINIQYTDAKI